MPVEVAAEAPLDDDDWEWMIALARARAEEPVAPATRPTRTRTRPMATVAVKDPASSGEWPKTEPIGAIDYDDHARVATRPVIAVPHVPMETPATQRTVPVTVIPVPVLPSLQRTSHAGRLQPVVRAAPSPVPPASPNRFPKGTGTVAPNTESYATSPQFDDTDPNVSVGDRTTPGIALPRAARAVALPSVPRGRTLAPSAEPSPPAATRFRSSIKRRTSR